MLDYTGAKALQEELTRRAGRQRGTIHHRELSRVTVDWRQARAALVAAVADVARVAAAIGGPTETPAEPEPLIDGLGGQPQPGGSDVLGGASG